MVLEDTVLFPEGGGQPSDRGKMGGGRESGKNGCRRGGECTVGAPGEGWGPALVHTHTHTHTHTGTVGGVTCVAVENVDGTAVHLVNGALEEGTQVDVHVDWPRLCSMNGACVFPS